MQDEEVTARLAAMPNPLNVSGIPFNFNQTHANLSGALMLNNSASFLGLGALSNGLLGAAAVGGGGHCEDLGDLNQKHCFNNT
jgi:hypothetical protein